MNRNGRDQWQGDVAEHLPVAGAVDHARFRKARSGIAAIPPSTISITSGVHCQVSTSTNDGITVADGTPRAAAAGPTSEMR